MSSSNQESEKLISGSSSILANLVFSKIGIENKNTDFNQDMTDNYIPMNDFTKGLIENSFKQIINKLLSIKIDILTVIKAMILFERSILFTDYKGSNLISLQNFKEYFLICVILKIKYQIGMDCTTYENESKNCPDVKSITKKYEACQNNMNIIESIYNLFNINLNDAQFENEILISLNFVLKIKNQEIEFYRNFFLMMSDYEQINSKDSLGINDAVQDKKIKVNNEDKLITNKSKNDSPSNPKNNISKENYYQDNKNYYYLFVKNNLILQSDSLITSNENAECYEDLMNFEEYDFSNCDFLCSPSTNYLKL